MGMEVYIDGNGKMWLEFSMNIENQYLSLLLSIISFLQA